MEAIKKQASKLREQVARQQQAILRQLGQLGHGGLMIDEADVELHQQLQNLYKSTRIAKHFQRDIVRGLEGFISTSKKQIEIVKKLAEDCCKYGIENQDSASSLAKVASDFGTSHASMEDHRERMLGILGYQVTEPLRSQINGAPLEDARHLTHRYDRMRQEFEIQAAEVIRRQSKSRDTSAETALKLKTAEKKLTELKSSMLTIGREATAAMSSVEDQQQETTFQKLLTMINAERSYHQNVIAILEKLHAEMILDEENADSSLQSEAPLRDDNVAFPNDAILSSKSNGQDDESKSDLYFIGKNGFQSREAENNEYIYRIMRGSLLQWLQILIYAVILVRIESIYVNITYVQSAVAKGAVCLDGSPPAYHFDKGFGSGNNSWLIQLEGGGWCNNVTSCLARKGNRLGSSKQMVRQLAFSGLLGNKGRFNPDFYNWNRVKVRYCDGSSFTGDVEAVNPVTKLHYRGARVFLAVIKDLLARGMKNADNAILSGCSAGGLAAILHCDNFKTLLPIGTKVKCLSDAGFFINTKDVSGAQHVAAYYDDIVTTHGSAKNLPQSCTLRMKPSLCFFPQYSARGIRTPLFLVNAAYDSWQIKNILAPDIADPLGHWHGCKTDIDKCSSSQLQIMQGFRSEFIRTVTGLGLSMSRGLFINSCYAHCQTVMQETWFTNDSPKLNNKTIARAVGDWFYDRSPFQRGDCPYPCDRTCHNRVFDPEELPLI